MLQDRAAAGPRRPRPQLPARQGAGRLLGDQRHDLHARPGGRLRPLAPARQPGLGLGRRAALLQALRGPLAGGGPAPRRRRRVAGRAAAAALGAARRLPRGRGPVRHPEGRRLQPRRQRGLRLLPGQPAPRRALDDRQGLPAPGSGAAEPRGRHRGPGHRPRARGAPLRRRRVPRGLGGAAGAGAARGRAGRGLDRLAAPAPDLRHRAGAAPQGPRHRGPARAAGRGREPAGPPAATADLQGPGRADAERDGGPPARAAARWRSSTC